MRKKLFCFAAALIVCLCLFVGCSDGNKYNAAVTAKSYEDAVDWLKGEFFEANRISGASYTVYEDGEYKTVSYPDEGYPKERTFLIENERDFEDIFTVTPQEVSVDFESQILIIYTCTAYNVRQVSVKRVSYNSDSLSINLQTKQPVPHMADTCQPYQRYMFITMDKLEVETVNVEYD